MSRQTFMLAFAGLLMVLLAANGTAYAQGDAGQRLNASADTARGLARSSGEYRGREWTIDEHQLMLWDGKPYVRFGFTGTGNPVQLIKLGFDKFTLMPDEEWPISGPDRRIVERVNETSDQLEDAGVTYYGMLNAFWPWRYGKLIAESDKAAVFVRDVRDVTGHAGQRLALELQVRLPISEGEQDGAKPARTQAVLFDMERGVRHDLSDQVEDVTAIIAGPGSEVRRETDDEGRDGKVFRVRFKSIHFPESTSLRLVVAMEVRRAELPGVNGLPPLWKPGLREFYRRSLEAFRPAYAKPGLRGLQFGDEINAFPQSLLAARTYLDLRGDAVALKAYRDWLAERFSSIDELNRQFGTSCASFDQVEWRVPLHPFSPDLARTDNDAEREESWAGATTTWSLAGTVEQVRTVSRVQDEFRIWFCGHWLAEYAKLAKQVIGPVPVFVCSAAIGGDADQYLAMHRWALREGVDGLIRNHYGNGGEQERYALASLARWMAKVQQESGLTKHLWANEVGYVRPGVTDDEWAASEAAELGAGDSFGSQWAFPSQESLRGMLVLLTQYGYRGFNRFLMNPSAPRAAQEVRWMAELRPETVSLIAKTNVSLPTPTGPARVQATMAGDESVVGPGREATMPFERLAAAMVNAKDHGVVGDGRVDDTQALQTALNAAEKKGPVCYLPAGQYRINGSLVVPPGVTLCGASGGVPHSEHPIGSVLLAYGGRGKADGEPLVTLKPDAVIRNLVIHYPEQTLPEVVAYPWTIRGDGELCQVLDITITNPYQALDFGTKWNELHLIRNVFACPLKTGLYIDQCTDIGRVENVHFNPNFWTRMALTPKYPGGDIKAYLEKNLVGFKIGKTDWEYMTNCFVIFPKIGFHFDDFGHGPGNAVITQSGSDICPVAVQVDRTQDHAGVQFVNGQFMATVIVGEKNRGPVKLTNCGFWGVPETREQVVKHGPSSLILNGCHFTGWDASKKGTPCIRADGGRLVVSGCEFMDAGKREIVLEKGLKAATISGCLLRGKESISDESGADVQIGLNTTQ